VALREAAQIRIRAYLKILGVPGPVRLWSAVTRRAYCRRSRGPTGRRHRTPQRPRRRLSPFAPVRADRQRVRRGARCWTPLQSRPMIGRCAYKNCSG
jgi:hypothetical protein